MSTFKAGETSKAEALQAIPNLRLTSAGPYGGHCEADECFSTGMGNSRISEALLIRVAGARNQTIYSMLTLLGLKFWSFAAYVNIKAEKVSYFSYWLVIGTPKLGRVKLDDVVVVEVTSTQRLATFASFGRETPAYRVLPSLKTPLQTVGIRLTPQAPSKVVHSAFDLKLTCLYLAGCERWDQLLPAVRVTE